MIKNKKFPLSLKGAVWGSVVLLACFILFTGIFNLAAQETNPQEQPKEPVQDASQPQQEQTQPEGKQPETKPAKEPTFKVPHFAFKGQEITLKSLGDFDKVFIGGKEVSGEKAVISETGAVKMVFIKNGKEYKHSTYSLHGIFTILPPLVAIILALIFKDVMIALFLGIFTGALFLNRFDFIAGFFNVIDKYILEAVIDKDRASIIIFTLLLGGMVGIISKSGGVKGIVDSLARRVQSTRGTQFYTWLMGVLIFFDDYTNTLIVGNTMRPLTDKWKISREKLAYIVDSTAAPMASIAMISTWIGFEISLINQALKAYSVEAEAYHLFLSSLPYRFYPILAMIFVVLVFSLRRDFGPMLKAEQRARKGKLMKDNAVPLSDFESSGLAPAKFVHARWYNGLIPIIVVIVFTFGGLYISGKASLTAAGNPLAQKGIFGIIFSSTVIKDLGAIVSASDSFKVLLWASLMGVVTGFGLAWSQKIMKLRDIVTAFVQGMKSMMMAIMILVLAWSLGVVLTDLKTADFLVSLISSSLDYHLFPAIVFIFSGFIAFATGTSWGTIAIMYPLVIPVIIGLLRHADNFEHYLILTISSVLAGAVFGDHCSPISDTTIMSSMASSCDHIDHVRTQIPYAFLMAVIALMIGIIPVSYGFPYILSMAVAVGISITILLTLGKKPMEEK
jgi:Na+/H+ antiporter NhaC